MFYKIIILLIIVFTSIMGCKKTNYHDVNFEQAAKIIANDMNQIDLDKYNIDILDNGVIRKIRELKAPQNYIYQGYIYNYSFIIRECLVPGSRTIIWQIVPELTKRVVGDTKIVKMELVKLSNSFTQETYIYWAERKAQNTYYRNRKRQYQIELVRKIIKKLKPELFPTLTLSIK